MGSIRPIQWFTIIAKMENNFGNFPYLGAAAAKIFKYKEIFPKKVCGNSESVLPA